jgi:hypothetical protein
MARGPPFLFSLSRSLCCSHKHMFLVLLTNNTMFGYCEDFFNLKHMQYNKLLRLVSRWSVPLADVVARTVGISLSAVGSSCQSVSLVGTDRVGIGTDCRLLTWQLFLIG